MADRGLMAARRSPLHGWSDRFDDLPRAIRVTEAPFMSVVNLRVKPRTDAAASVVRELGVDLPTSPMALTHAGGIDVIRLAPDEFLVMSDTIAADDLSQRIRGALGSTAEGAVTDVSAQYTLIELGGRESRDLLAGGCSADLTYESAPTGTTVHTQLAQANAVIIVTDAARGRFRLVVRSSFAEYVASWLIAGSAEYRSD